MGLVRFDRKGCELPGQAHWREPRCQSFVADAPSPCRALGGSAGSRAGDPWRGCVRPARKRIRVHPFADQTPLAEHDGTAAGDHRGAMRRLSRRGRHRPFRRRVRARMNAAIVIARRVPPVRMLTRPLALLWRYRVLLRHMTWREISSRYRESVLGTVWAVINPLLMLSIYTF